MPDIAAKVRAILAPPARKNRLGLLVTSDAYYNLEGVIQELRHQKGDAVQIRTLERVQKQISDVMKICASAHTA